MVSVGSNSSARSDGVGGASLYCQVPEGELWIAKWIAIAILVVVASGWRPRITGILHWWVSWSYFSSSMMMEGGDQLTANLALLLIPITLTDDRTWHWEERTAVNVTAWSEASKRMIARSTWVVIRVQVALVYLHSSIGKMGVEEWVNGTALYYWLTHPLTGAPGWRATIITPLLTNGVTVTLLTWGVIVYELFLFTALVMDKKWWPFMLYSAFAFHAGIAFFQGLVSFSIAMFGALVLYLRPPDSPFEFRLPQLKSLRSVTRVFPASRERRAQESAA